MKTLLLATALAAALPVQAQLFKCLSKDGKTLYQDQPCETTSKQSQIRGAPPPPSSAPAEEAKDKPKEGEADAPDKPVPELTRQAIEVVVGYAMCSERVPGFTEKYTAPYEAWKRRNQAQMDRMSKQAEARILNERLRIERTRTESFEDRCEAFGAQLATSGPSKEAKQ